MEVASEVSKLGNAGKRRGSSWAKYRYSTVPQYREGRKKEELVTFMKNLDYKNKNERRGRAHSFFLSPSFY